MTPVRTAITFCIRRSSGSLHSCASTSLGRHLHALHAEPPRRHHSPRLRRPPHELRTPCVHALFAHGAPCWIRCRPATERGAPVEDEAHVGVVDRGLAVDAAAADAKGALPAAQRVDERLGLHAAEERPELAGLLAGGGIGVPGHQSAPQGGSQAACRRRRRAAGALATTRSARRKVRCCPSVPHSPRDSQPIIVKGCRPLALEVQVSALSLPPLSCRHADAHRCGGAPSSHGPRRGFAAASTAPVRRPSLRARAPSRGCAMAHWDAHLGAHLGRPRCGRKAEQAVG